MITFQRSMTEIFAEYMAAADILGRLHVLQEMQRKTGEVPERMNTLMPSQFGDSEVLGFESVPNENAIKRIRNLTGYTRQAFDGLKARYRQSAFTIAGISDVKLIDAIKDKLEETLRNGGTIDDFRREVDKLTDAAELQHLVARHINTVFLTSVQRAYSYGRLEQMSDPAVKAALPYWKYFTAGDDRVRPAHAALDGFVAGADDPVWRRLYPPVGFNCRCSVVPILEDEAPEGSDVPGLTRIPAEAANVPDPGFSPTFAEERAA